MAQKLDMLKSIGHYLLAAFILSIPAFFNGYPLIYSDSGTYITSGFDMYVPIDRPLLYGLFIRIFSLGHSLWFVVWTQCLILAYVFSHLVRFMMPTVSKSSVLLLVSFLTAFTSIGWYTSQLMPDLFIFTSIGCFILLSLSPSLTKIQKTLLVLIAIFSISTHFSHLLICTLILVSLIGLKLARKQSYKTVKTSILAILLGSSLVLSISINYALDKSIVLSKGGHVFLIGRMLDNGVLQSYLDDKCSSEDYSLCQYKDSLPADSRAFLWSDTSPVNLDGGWLATSDSYTKILRGILTSPKHLSQFIFTSATSSISQLFQNDIGSGLESTWYAKPGSPPYGAVKEFFPHEMNQYLQSRQNNNLWGQGLKFNTLNTINFVLLLASIFIIYLGMVVKKNRKLLHPNLMLASTIVLAGIIFNAVVIASLANVYDRLQSRISWVIVLIAILIIIQLGRRLYYNTTELFRV
jgi:hypothetical protein